MQVLQYDYGGATHVVVFNEFLQDVRLMNNDLAAHLPIHFQAISQHSSHDHGHSMAEIIL